MKTYHVTLTRYVPENLTVSVEAYNPDCAPDAAFAKLRRTPESKWRQGHDRGPAFVSAVKEGADNAP